MKKIRWDLIGIVFGITGVIMGAIAVLKAGGQNSIYIAAALVIVFGLMGYIPYKFLWQPKFNIRRLLADGIPAKAKILEVHETNITINSNPQFSLQMEIKNDVGHVYTAACKTVISRRSNKSFQAGKEINIKIDPKDEKNVIVV